MPRPCKRRRVCAVPSCRRFGSLEGGAPADGSPREPRKRQNIAMTVDEYEAVRLIDLERLTQAECALQMGVARATVQSIYESARIKLAKCLVEGGELHIGGGEYVVCEGPSPGCGCARCKKVKHLP